MVPRPFGAPDIIRSARRRAGGSGRIIYCPTPGHKIVVMRAPFDLGKPEIGS
jgi:hypothetical protein